MGAGVVAKRKGRPDLRTLLAERDTGKPPAPQSPERGVLQMVLYILNVTYARCAVRTTHTPEII